MTFQMDGWMTCDFTSFSTVFQSYQDDGQMIIKEFTTWLTLRCIAFWHSVYPSAMPRPPGVLMNREKIFSEE